MGNEEAATTKTALAVIESSPPGIREILSAVINLSDGGIYYEPSCLFCASRSRTEAERLWASFDIMVKNPEERISAFFSSAGEAIPIDVIKNHITAHMGRGDIEIRKVEYVSRLAALSGNQMTTLSQSKLATAAVLECLSNVGAIVPTKGLSVSKAMEIKATIVTRLVKTWADLMEMQAKMSGEMWNEGKMVAIPTSDFYRIFDDSLKNAKTPDERSAVANILDNLTKAIQK